MRIGRYAAVLAESEKFHRMKHILTIVGARPQFVKAAVVSRAIQAKSGQLRETIVHTGQHYDPNMSDIFFEELKIPQPNIHLGIGGGTHGRNTGRMIEAIESAILERAPDIVLVYGDTDSTLAGAIAASKMNIVLAHVEAGLRSYNRRMPEELNRILTDHASDILFTPSATATTTLAKEGTDSRRVCQVGDVMYDAVLFYRKLARRPIGVDSGSDFVLATIHRAENTNEPHRLREIMGALSEVSRDVQVVLPLHPRTRKSMERFGVQAERVKFLDPVSYLEMAWLLENCAMVVTDSGGLQKEAFFFGKRCVTARDETEWTELISLGWNVLCGAQKDTILRAMRQALSTAGQIPGGLPAAPSPFGAGDAGKRIVARLIEC